MRHGGDLDAAVARYGGPRDAWLDLSTGINPVATPHTAPPARAWARLPEAADERALDEAARRAYGVPDRLDVLAVPGTQAVLQVLPRLVPRSDVAVVGPTYSEHARCWRLAGHRVREVSEPEPADVLVVVNPNNPDGCDRDPAALVDRAPLTVIDEAFRDTRPERSVLRVRNERTVVLKSLGKFHGLAGVRLGHAIGPPSLIEPIRDALGPWAVSGPTLHVGRAALAADQGAIARGLRDRAERLLGILRAMGVPIVGRTDFFALVRVERAELIHDRLAERRIWTRRFDDHPGWLRIGLPGDDGFDRLAAALREALAAGDS